MISIDPEHDTAAVLGKIAKKRRIGVSRWMLANTDVSSIRKIAAALGIQYRQSADREFNHSSVISVLTPSDEIAQQSSMLGKADDMVINALAEMKLKPEAYLAKSARLAEIAVR